MPSLNIHIQDATGYAGVTRKNRSNATVSVAVICLCVGILIGLAVSGVKPGGRPASAVVSPESAASQPPSHATQPLELPQP